MSANITLTDVLSFSPTRSISTLLILIIFWANPLRILAGDEAQLHIIGFSPDSKYFAFEQYGVQDGSGFPYSEVFIIHTASDRWIKNTPIRVLIHDENQSIYDAREESALRALLFIERLSLASPSVSLISSNAQAKQKENASVTFSLPATLKNKREKSLYDLMLEQWETKNPLCEKYGTRPKLFRLLLTGVNIGHKEIYEDKFLPKNRRCPINYRIHDIITNAPETTGSRVTVVILEVARLGFEGPDKRFMAIAFYMDKLFPTGGWNHRITSTDR